MQTGVTFLSLTLHRASRLLTPGCMTRDGSTTWTGTELR